MAFQDHMGAKEEKIAPSGTHLSYAKARPNLKTAKMHLVFTNTTRDVLDLSPTNPPKIFGPTLLNPHSKEGP